MPGLAPTYRNGWAGAPTNDSGGDTAFVTLGLRMKANVDGHILGVRFYRDLADGADHVGMLWRADNMQLIDTCFFHNKPASGSGADGWQSAYFRKNKLTLALDRFVIGVMFGQGRYWLTPGALAAGPINNGAISITQDGDAGANGLFDYGQLRPLSSFGSAAYGVDVIYLPG